MPVEETATAKTKLVKAKAISEAKAIVKAEAVAKTIVKAKAVAKTIVKAKWTEERVVKATAKPKLVEAKTISEPKRTETERATEAHSNAETHSHTAHETTVTHHSPAVPAIGTVQTLIESVGKPVVVATCSTPTRIGGDTPLHLTGTEFSVIISVDFIPLLPIRIIRILVGTALLRLTSVEPRGLPNIALRCFAIIGSSIARIHGCVA